MSTVLNIDQPEKRRLLSLTSRKVQSININELEKCSLLSSTSWNFIQGVSDAKVSIMNTLVDS